MSAERVTARRTDDGGRARLTVTDRVLYALFARRADSQRHDRDRHRYRGTDLRVGFDVYLARVYGLSWVVAATAWLAATVAFAVVSPPAALVDLGRVVPGVPLSAVPHVVFAAVGGGAVAAGCKHAVVRLGGAHLRWRASARQVNVERTLPGAVRYLHVLSTGSDDARGMLRKVAATDAYGETAVAFRRALNTAALTGNLGEGLRRAARDSPSQDLLAPFLLKFAEHTQQGSDALANYLRMESRMLGHRQDRARERAEGFLELLSELFMVTLVLPALLMIILTVMSVLSPGLSEPVVTPVGTTTVRGVIVYASAVFVVGVGVGASLVVAGVRPPDQTVEYGRPDGVIQMVGSIPTNPRSAAVGLAVPAAAVGVAAAAAGVRPIHALAVGYVGYAVPVGAVAIRRAKRDDAKDRELKDFVHAVSGHVSLGRPFPRAVEQVARDVDLGPLDEDVADLAKNLSFTTHEGDSDTRTAALDRFVDRVGTPLAAQTVGLVTGALDGGSDAATVFDTLQAEIGRLYHEKRALRSSMLVYVAVGWTTALLVVGITAAVATYIFDGFAQLSSVGAAGSYVIEADAVAVARERFRIYAVTQATMLAAGWFAGTASRGRYEALLHSGLLVAVCALVYVGAGLV